ncbi:MAG: PAS domain S-box protein [Sandaracinaceae bacterium]|jgi:two-component system cell cycle sensor histidine kinase/response regulator CckA|nr:PAS domain S-box protein [Sandaracinaceae bacterium]
MFWGEQTAVLERVAAKDALAEILRDIVAMIEKQAEGMACSLLLLDDATQTFRTSITASLPNEYAIQLLGLEVGPHAGSCGAAAFLHKRVIVEDIATHPNWKPYRQTALAFGLKACWSTPIISSTGGVLGTFAMYYYTSRAPSPEECGWVDAATHLAAVAIESDRDTTALRQSEERLRAIIERTPDVAIQWYDDAGRVIFYNEASRRLFKWTERGAIGKTLLELGFWTVREEQRFAEARVQAAADQHVAPTQFAFARPDGSDGYLLSTVFRIPLSASEHCYVCMDVDLTEQHRMEASVRANEALRALIYDLVTDIIFYLEVDANQQYRFKSVNHAFLLANGLREDQVVGRLVDEVFAPASLALTKAKYAESIAARGRVSWEEVSRSETGLHYGHVSVSPVHDDAGKCTHLVGTVHDLTERRAAEHERREIEHHLLHSQRLQALGTLAGGIAHDFNNLLAAIHLNLDMALESVASDAKTTANLHEVKQAAQRATAMVKQIFAFGRQGEAPRELLSLQPVVEEAVRLVSVTLKPNVKLRTHFASDLPIVRSDSTQIHQVVVNLVTNAAQAIGDSPGEIDLRLESVFIAAGTRRDLPDADEGPYVQLTVQDTGAGMDMSTQKRVFEPFFTTKASGVGTGLGLSVVHGIVKNHGGFVTLQSEVGKGSTFSLFLPALTELATGKKSGPIEQVRKGSLRILFVDDDEALVILARRAFAHLGHRVTAYCSSQQALEDFRQRAQEFDVIVTDIKMPVLDGPALVRALRQIRPDVRVVLMSGALRPEDEAMAKELNVTRLFEKPQSLYDLAKLVTLYLT